MKKFFIFSLIIALSVADLLHAGKSTIAAEKRTKLRKQLREEKTQDMQEPAAQFVKQYKMRRGY